LENHLYGLVGFPLNNKVVNEMAAIAKAMPTIFIFFMQVGRRAASILTRYRIVVRKRRRATTHGYEELFFWIVQCGRLDFGSGQLPPRRRHTLKFNPN
jgi:hypothetical protein